MPYKPSKRAIKRKDGGVPLTEEQLQHLIFGWVWLEGWDYFPFETEEHRRQCWQRHKKEIMAMMTDEKPSCGFRPHLLVGQRPEGWFEYENVPPRKKVKVHTWKQQQPTPDYLNEHGLWLADEKRKYLRMRENEDKLLRNLQNISDISEFRGKTPEVFSY